MKQISAIAGALALGLWSSSALAEFRPASCTLIVKGETYINGLCQFEADKDGSFRIASKDYFVYVNVTGKTAEASWNADPKATHAHAPLGVLTRKGACWENADARICARDLPTAQKAAALAAQPRGEYATPDVPGASSSCVDARGGKWIAGAPLVIVNCPADGSTKRFQRGSDAITIDKSDGLCVGVSGAGSAALQKCGEPGASWSAGAAGQIESVVVRSPDNRCWTVPKTTDESAVFPFEIVVAPCNAKSDKQLKFFFAKD